MTCSNTPHSRDRARVRVHQVRLARGHLDGQALYACQYFMSRGHWQIYNHGQNAAQKSGGFKTLPVREAPNDVIKLALKATAPIGDGSTASISSRPTGAPS